MSDAHTQIETDVLIVGSGPAGGSAALMLARYGVKALMISRYNWTARTPRAHITNQRTMEVFRDLGIEQDALDVGTPQELMGQNVFCESLTGEEIGRLHSWGTGPDRAGDYALSSPSPMIDLPQTLLEPILVSNAAKSGTDIRFNTEYVSMVQDADGVTARVRDRLTGLEYDIRCKYLIGADGGNSKVAADINLPFEGEMGLAGSMNILFDADLTQYVSHRPSVLYWVLQPGSEVGGVGMGVVRMVRPWNQWLAIWGYDINDGEPDLADADATKIVRNLIGDQDIPITIKGTSTWTVNHCYATKTAKERVFCLGDAIHRHPPTNGLGSNTSIQDSYNLCWKLAMVLKQQAGPDLLKSYDAERAPIAKQIVDRANQSVADYGPIFDSLGLLSTKDPDQMKANIAERKDATEQAAEKRTKLRAAIAAKTYEFNCHGVEMNQQYESDAVFADTIPTVPSGADEQLYYHTTTRPGARLPHVWIYEDGHEISTLDVIGSGQFTLITGIGGAQWHIAGDAMEAALGLPITIVSIGPGQQYEDLFGTWNAINEIKEAGMILVRPDGHVAARSLDSVDDPVAFLDGVLRHILKLK